MPTLQPIVDPALDDLAARSLGRHGASDWGLTLWQGSELSGVWRAEGVLPGGSVAELLASVAHDERGGPYPTDDTGVERRNLLISLSDEQDHIACAWARVKSDSPIMGVGVDLCAERNFDRVVGHRKRRTVAELLLTEHERELATSIGVEDPDLARSVLFAAKEAAFKSTAAPLRRWYDSHDEPLMFELRHFVMEELGREQGTGRDGAAQRAMDRMHIARIQVEWALVDGLAVVLAVALAGDDRS